MDDMSSPQQWDSIQGKIIFLKDSDDCRRKLQKVRVGHFLIDLLKNLEKLISHFHYYPAK